jgi:hypothetical protein
MSFLGFSSGMYWSVQAVGLFTEADNIGMETKIQSTLLCALKSGMYGQG